MARRPNAFGGGGGPRRNGSGGGDSGDTAEESTDDDDDEIRIDADQFEADVNEARAEKGLDPVDTDQSGDVATYKSDPEDRQRERQGIRNAAEAVTEDPGFQQQRQQERDEAVQAARSAAEAVSQDPGREQAEQAARQQAQRGVQQAARAVQRDPGRQDQPQRQQSQQREEQAGDIRVGIPGTDRTLEGITEDAARAINERVTDPAAEAAGKAADTLADPGGTQIRAGEESSTVRTSDTTAGDVTESATRSVVGLANIPRTARGVDELVIEPTAEVAAGGPPERAPERAERLADYGGRRAAAAFDEYFEVSESRLESLQEGDVGSVSDEPLVSVEPDREAEVGGLLAGGIASAGLTGGAFAATQGSRLGKATRVAVQPGEEAAIAAANRGLASPRVASAVPGVRRGQFDFGSADEGVPSGDFEIRDPIEDRQLRTGGGVELEPVGRQRPRPGDRPGPPGRSRPAVDEPTIDIRAGRPTVSREAVVESEVRSRPALDADIDTTLRRFEADARRRDTRDTRDPVTGAMDRLDAATEPLEDVGGRAELDSRLESRLDTGIETGLDVRTELRQEPRLETGQETRQETRQELRTELRTEGRLETRTEGRQELRSELTFPEFDEELDEDDNGPFDVLEASRERTTGLATGEELLDAFENA